MRLDVLLQILRALERLSAEVAFVRFQWNVDPYVGGDVIALHSGSSARVPATGKVEIVCALAPDVLLTDVLEKSFCRSTLLRALIPLAG